MNIRQLKLEKMCLYGFISNFYRFDLNGSISYVHTIFVNISESLQILMWFRMFFANNVIRGSFRKIRNLFGYYSDNNLELGMAGGNEH